MGQPTQPGEAGNGLSMDQVDAGSLVAEAGDDLEAILSQPNTGLTKDLNPGLLGASLKEMQDRLANHRRGDQSTTEEAEDGVLVDEEDSGPATPPLAMEEVTHTPITTEASPFNVPGQPGTGQTMDFFKEGDDGTFKGSGQEKPDPFA